MPGPSCVPAHGGRACRRRDAVGQVGLTGRSGSVPPTGGRGAAGGGSGVATVCMGLGASMGQFLLCAGAKDKRYALPHARIMMHQPSGGFRGQAADIAIQAEQIIYMKRMMAERIAQHTGQPVEKIEEDSDRDRWFTAADAQAYGFIDKVIEKTANVAPPE